MISHSPVAAWPLFYKTKLEEKKYSFASMYWKKGQILAACVMTHHEANPDSLHIGIIASFATWKDNMPQSPVLWMVYPPPSTSHPKTTHLATALSYWQQSWTSEHVPMWPSLPKHCGLEGGQRASDAKNETHHKTPMRGSWISEGAAAAGGCAAARQSFQLPSESKEQGMSAGGAGPQFGTEYSYCNMAWTDFQEWLEKEAGRWWHSLHVKVTIINWSKRK